MQFGQAYSVAVDPLLQLVFFLRVPHLHSRLAVGLFLARLAISLFLVRLAVGLFLERPAVGQPLPGAPIP